MISKPEQLAERLGVRTSPTDNEMIQVKRDGDWADAYTWPEMIGFLWEDGLEPAGIAMTDVEIDAIAIIAFNIGPDGDFGLSGPGAVSGFMAAKKALGLITEATQATMRARYAALVGSWVAYELRCNHASFQEAAARAEAMYGTFEQREALARRRNADLTDPAFQRGPI